MSDLKCGHAAADAECLGFRSERYDAAVIVERTTKGFPHSSGRKAFSQKAQNLLQSVTAKTGAAMAVIQMARAKGGG